MFLFVTHNTLQKLHLHKHKKNFFFNLLPCYGDLGKPSFPSLRNNFKLVKKREKINKQWQSAGPNYIKNMIKLKSDTKSFFVKIEKVTQDVIFDWSNLWNLTIEKGQLDRQDSESTNIFSFWAFLLFFTDF